MVTKEEKIMKKWAICLIVLGIVMMIMGLYGYGSVNTSGMSRKEADLVLALSGSLGINSQLSL